MKQTLCEALYALPEGDVVARRRTIYMPLAAVVAGIALLITNYTSVDDKAGALSMIMLVAGFVLLIYGAVAIILRLVGGECVPCHTGEGGYMHYRERYFDRALLGPLSRAIEHGDVEAIEQMPTTNISAVVLAEYSTSSRHIVSYALYEYADFENRLILGPKVHRR